MPNRPESPSTFQIPFQVPFQMPLAPWFVNSANQPQGETGSPAAAWGQALEAQLRLWGQMVDLQRKFWSFYMPLLERAPVFTNGGARTVAEEEHGLEPAETADGIPDAMELQLRTWNHFLDAHRSFWTKLPWTTANGEADAAAEDESTDEQEPAPAPKPRKTARRR